MKKFHLTLVAMVAMIASSLTVNVIANGNPLDNNAKQLYALRIAKSTKPLYINNKDNNKSNIKSNNTPNINNKNVRNNYVISNIKATSKSSRSRSSSSRIKLTHTQKIEIVMWAIKQVESNGNYKAKSKYSSASGAYQFIDSTWNKFCGYKRAVHAPQNIQDERARGMIRGNYRHYGNWEQTIASHYYPARARDRSTWDLPGPNGQPSVREYVNRVKAKIKQFTAPLGVKF